ncbi:MAG: MBOAT family protein, partial [Clostridia bacterium]|nr:MBOAT family protein [Clostridia bacterium]
ITKTKILNHIYTVFVIVISFVIFDAVNISEAFSYIKAMVGFSSLPFVSTEFLYYLKEYSVVIILALIGSTPLLKTVLDKLSELRFIKPVLYVFEPVVLITLLVLVTSYLIDGSFNPFLYFRF